MSSKFNALLAFTILVLSIAGCNMRNDTAANQPSIGNTDAVKANSAQVKPNEDGTIPSVTGVEKEKPAAGKGNVQGKAFFNEKPAAGVEVKLCKTFSQFGSG